MLVEERFSVPVAPDAPYPSVAEPLACVVNAVELAGPRLGDDVVIVGAGYMGNLVQMVAALKGPRTVTVADVRTDALARARRGWAPAESSTQPARSSLTPFRISATAAAPT